MRENKEGGKNAEDPSAFRHGHFHFYHTENFFNHFNRHRGERDRKQRRRTRSGKRLMRLNKSVGVWGLPEKTGHRDV